MLDNTELQLRVLVCRLRLVLNGTQKRLLPFVSQVLGLQAWIPIPGSWIIILKCLCMSLEFCFEQMVVKNLFDV